MRKARGVTLLELLVAIALLGALAALVLPALAGRVGGATLTAAAEELESAAARARARSVAGGRPAVLLAVPRGDRTRLYADDLSPAPHAPGSGDAEGDTEAGPLELSPAAELLAELPAAFELQDAAPEAEGQGPPSEGVEDEPAAPAEAPPVVRLAVFLPDGSPLWAAPVYLVGPGRRAFRLDVGACTGRARVTVVDPPAPEGQPTEPPEREPPPADGEGGEGP